MDGVTRHKSVHSEAEPPRRGQVKASNAVSRYKIDTALVERLAKRVLGKVAKGRYISLEILFAGDRDIQKLNRRFKKRDRTTDVLSFELGDVGSIAISLDTARRNAKMFGAPIHEEMMRYVIHGILHLFGYDDDTGPNRLKMADKEDKMLESLCATTDLSKVLTRR